MKSSRRQHFLILLARECRVQNYLRGASRGCDGAGEPRGDRCHSGATVERLGPPALRRPARRAGEPTTHCLLPTHALIVISQALNNTFTDAHFTI